MTPRQTVFVSAVSKELRSSRDVVAKTLYALGYEPVWQDVMGTGQGDLRAMLRRKIDESKGLIQLVGYRYGAEPGAIDPEFGRLSYTQYEAVYARRTNKKVWYLINNSAPPTTSDEPEELTRLQEDYRIRICKEGNLYHRIDLTNDDSLAVTVHGIKDELSSLRRSFTGWTRSVTVVLTIILLLLAWLVIRQTRVADPVTPESAETAFASKDYASSFHSYIRLTGKYPSNLGYHRRIEESARLGSLQKPMLDHYLQQVRDDPDNALFRNYLGNAYLLVDPSDKDGRAAGHYASALKIDPDFAPPLANLGILAARSGRTSEARTLFERYLQAQPDDAQAWTNLALLHIATFKENPAHPSAAADAEAALGHAIRLDPGSSTAFGALARLRNACGRRDEAVEACRLSLSLNPDQPELREWLAHELGESGESPLPPDDFRTRGVKEASPNQKPAPKTGATTLE